jgi:DNA-binding NarL/FixJ family response regulator
MWLLLEPDITVVGEAYTGEDALSLAQRLSPDVVLLAVGMPDLDGIAVAAALRACAPRCAVVVLILYEDAFTQAQAQAVGAVAVVAKHRTTESLLATIRAAARGAP